MQSENDFEIKKMTAFKCGGTIKKVFFPAGVNEFTGILEDNPDALVFGSLSNTLVSSDGYDGTVILTSKMDKITFDGEYVTAECGVKGPKLAQTASDKGLSGLEFMIAFPGSIGGEVFMNAGAHGQSVSDVLAEAVCYDKTKGVITLTKDEMDFSYRTSICQKKDLIVLSAKFKLKSAPAEQIKTRMKDNLEFRKAKQPSLALPNCGSVFRNPEGDSAGRLLEGAGAKSFKSGGARVWENHANFIVNDNGGTSTDVLELMCQMYNAVKEKYNVKLKPEVRFLGGKNDREAELCRILYQW